MTQSSGFNTYALVERLGANAASITMWPQENFDLAMTAAQASGLELSPMEAGGLQAALYFQEEDFGDQVLGELADALTRCGVGAYAYQLSHGDGLEEHVDLFVRLGSCSPLLGGQTVFLRGKSFPLGEGLGDGLVTVVFGAPDDLAALLPALSDRFVPEVCHDPDGGIASILMRHDEAAFGRDAAATVLDDLCMLIIEAGMDAQVSIGFGDEEGREADA